jgi:hypothetical protein
MLTGSCLCGSVAYEAGADPGSSVHCHCRTCRKTHGSAFSTVTKLLRDRFRWTRGEGLLSGFESSPGKTRRAASANSPASPAALSQALAAAKTDTMCKG